MNKKEKAIIGILMALLIIGAITVVFGSIIFGLGGFFSLIGVSYDSFGSLGLFILYCILIGVIFEVIEQLILVFIKRANLSTKKQWVWIALIKLVLSWMTIHIVNDLMASVNLSFIAEWLTAALIVSIDIIFKDKEDE